MSFFYTICRFTDEGEVEPIGRENLARIVSRYSLGATDRDGVYVFRDGAGTSEVDISDGSVIQLPRPLGTENMERFIFGVLELTGGTMFSPQFDGAVTASRDQLSHIPDDLPPRLVESWRELKTELRAE